MQPVIIAQILLPGASEYERKCQRVDFAALSPRHQVSVYDDVGKVTGAEIAHEAVEERYFEPCSGGLQAADDGGLKPAATRIASFHRRSIASLVEQTMHRLHRTRDDIKWMLLERVPTPDDYDGFVAEAIVRGIATVATRTPLNVHRLEKGRTGFLVPVGDANELTHAILAALFKPEVAQQKIDAARQTIAKFRARRRTRVLTALYESLRR
jgi:hypothetical protein